jgi:hypothetical protein
MRLLKQVCQYVAMFRRKLYQRSTAVGVETLKVVGSFDDNGGDCEIRVTHTVADSVVDDRIGYHGLAGDQWLQNRHASWTGDGFELISSGPDY